MTAYVALLHSVVLSPGRRMAMSDLRAMAENLGYRDPRTLVATGNLVFHAAGEAVGTLEAELEAAFERRFGKHVDIIVRTGVDWLRVAERNPYLDGRASEVILRAMRRPLEPSAVDDLQRHRRSERIAVVEGDLWVDFAGRPSESKLLPALTTRRLGVGTLRNWNTVRGLAEMLGAWNRPGKIATDG